MDHVDRIEREWRAVAVEDVVARTSVDEIAAVGHDREHRAAEHSIVAARWR